MPDRARSIRVDGFRIDVVIRSDVDVPVAAATLARTAAHALGVAGAPAGSVLALTFSNDAELATLNAEHMGHRGPTDVLSFPLLPPSAFPSHPGKAPAGTDGPRFVLPPGRRPHVGDVVVSIERAREQAAEGRGGQTGDVRWSVADEVRLLVVHGVLHVCGWDHAEAEEEHAMRALERELLAAAR